MCWVQLSGPAVVLYGFTIFAQPGSDEDEYALLINENKEHFFRVHREYYVPVLNALFVLLIVSMASSLYLLRKKWKAFREREFSPAHVIFACPTVAYTNTLQAYRSSFLKYSLSPPGTPFKVSLKWFCLQFSQETGAKNFVIFAFLNIRRYGFTAIGSCA